MTNFKRGDRVHYQPSHFAPTEFENGVVKSLPPNNPNHVFVVYNCGGNWHRYLDYTAALTHVDDLHLGWKENF